MSSITSTAAASAASTTRQASQDVIDISEHALSLFVTQLKYQDPLEPMESSDMMASLATISEAGQTVQMNTNLEEIIALLGGSSQFGTPVSYLGKDIEYESSDFMLLGGESEFFYELEERPENVFVTVYDRAGNAVFTADGSDAIGKNRILWNGTDQQGNQLNDGLYSVSVAVVNEEGELPQELQTSVLGTVTQASFQDGQVVLLVGDIIVQQDAVLSVFPERSIQQANNNTDDDGG